MPGKPYIDGKSISQRLDDIGIDEICEQIANCVPLRVIAANEGISKGSLINWLAEHSEQYSRARDAQADTLVEDLLAIADDGSNDTYENENGTQTNHDVIARSRLRVDARKWLASKMAPKKYGDKLAIGGAEDMPALKMITDLIVSIDGTSLKIK